MRPLQRWSATIVNCSGGIILLQMCICPTWSAPQNKHNDNHHHASPWFAPRWRLPGHLYRTDEDDDDDDDNAGQAKQESKKSGFGWRGLGREWSLFDNTNDTMDDQGSIHTVPHDQDDGMDEHDVGSARAREKIRLLHGIPPSASNPAETSSTRNRGDPLATSANPAAEPLGDHENSRYLNYPSGQQPSHRRNHGSKRRGNQHSYHPKNKSSASPPSSHHSNNAVHTVKEWWSSHMSTTMKHWPKIQCRIEPTTTLKIRKTFRPLKTIVRFSANFNTQRGVWQFHSSWEDAIIGGKLTLAGRKELQLTKSWQLSVGSVEDLVTRLRLRAAVDLQTWKAYVRVGFRTERLSPINVMEGLALVKQIPLDGVNGHVKLEVKANVALPEPEIEYSTETQRSLVGMGDIEVSIEELNLLLDY